MWTTEKEGTLLWYYILWSVMAFNGKYTLDGKDAILNEHNREEKNTKAFFVFV